MKKVLLGTLAVLTLAACSKDEVIQQSPNDEISFSIVTNKAVSRAADGYCNNVTPAEMKVSALYTKDGSTWKTYFTNETYKKAEASDDAEKDYVIPTGSGLRYWPDLGSADDGIKMKFFAMVNATPAWDGTTGMTVADFAVKKDVGEQIDVLYAVQEVGKRPTGGVQPINFRHALSQIEFMAKNENPNIYVEITGVQVKNVWDKGTVKFSKSTASNVGAHATTPTTPFPAVEDLCEWKGYKNSSDDSDAAAKTDYGVTFNKVQLSQKTYISADSYSATQAEASSLTTEDATGEWNENTMYLLPQTITPWNPGTDDTPAVGKGTYFLVKTKIWNVPAGNGHRADTSNDVVLWGGADGKEIAIPAPNVPWVPGKRYVYTFVFTEKGNGGYDPGTGDPVLVPITLNVSVDDFVNGFPYTDGGGKTVDGTVDMNKKP